MKIIHYINQFLLGLTLLSATIVHALDSEGNISVAGFVETNLNDLRDTLFSVTQYNASGQINTTFGEGGLATLGFRHGIAMDVAVDNNDNIIVVGTAIDPAVGLPRAIIARFLPTGNPDMSFNPIVGGALDGGPGFGWFAPAPSIANSIITEGGSNRLCGSFILNRRYRGFSYIINPNATFVFSSAFSDPDIKLNAIEGFIQAGKYCINGIPRPIVMALNPSNSTPQFIGSIQGEFLDIIRADLQPVPPFNIYAVGKHANKGLLTKLIITNLNPFALSLDTSFGSNGYVIAEFNTKQTTFSAVQVDISTDPERIFVCGTARGLQSHMFVAEYDSSGNLVPTFGDNGIMTIFEGPNVQTIARDLVLPKSFSCPSGSSTGMFALGAANGRTPLLANLSCSGGTLKNEYGDKAIASLETEKLTAMTVLKEVEATGDDLLIPSSSPFTREFNALLGNPFAVSLTGSGTGTGFVLQPGRYYVDAQAPIQDVATHQLALYNDRQGMNEVFGDSIWNSSGILTKALLKGQLFVADATKYILRHYFTGNGPSFAVGNAANIAGLEEIYAQMNIQQL